MGLFKVVWLLCALPVIGGCSSSEKAAASVEITTLRVRGGFIEIRTGAQGRTYGVLDESRAVIARDLTPRELESRYPERYETLERALAEAYSSLILDASNER